MADQGEWYPYAFSPFLQSFGGDMIDRETMTSAEGVLNGEEAAALGRGARYGLGVIIRDTPLGPAWGHSGFFPGYLTEMRYYPQHRIAVAVQVNNSNGRTVGRPLGALLHDLAGLAVGTR